MDVTSYATAALVLFGEVAQSMWVQLWPCYLQCLLEFFFCSLFFFFLPAFPFYKNDTQLHKVCSFFKTVTVLWNVFCLGNVALCLSSGAFFIVNMNIFYFCFWFPLGNHHFQFECYLTINCIYLSPLFFFNLCLWFHNVIKTNNMIEGKEEQPCVAMVSDADKFER